MKYIYRFFLIFVFIISIFLLYIAFVFVLSDNGKYPTNLFGVYLYSDSEELYVTSGNKYNISIGDFIMFKNTELSSGVVNEETAVSNVYSITRNNIIQVQVNVNNNNKVIPIDNIYGIVDNSKKYDSRFFDFLVKSSYINFIICLLYFSFCLYFIIRVFKRNKVIQVDIYQELALIEPKVDRIKYSLDNLEVKKQTNLNIENSCFKEIKKLDDDKTDEEGLNIVVNSSYLFYEFLDYEYLKDKEVVSIYSDNYNIDDYLDNIFTFFEYRKTQNILPNYKLDYALNYSLLKKDQNSDSFSSSLALKVYSLSNNNENFDYYDCLEEPYYILENLDYFKSK